MWEKIKEFAEKHPIWLGLIVFGVGALIIWLIFGGSGSSNAPASSDNTGYYNALAAATESGNQLQAAQLQLQAAGQQTTAQLSAQQDVDATQLAITKSNNDAQVQIATAQITEQGQEAALAAQTTQQVSSLQANVAQSNINSQVSLAQIAANVNTTDAQIAAQNSIIQTQYNTNLQALNTQALLTQSENQSQIEAALVNKLGTTAVGA